METLPDVMQISRQKLDKIYQSYDEQLLESPNRVEDRLQTALATLLARPIYALYVFLDAIAYHGLGIAAQYPDLNPRQGFSLRLLPILQGILNGFRLQTPENLDPYIQTQPVVGLSPLAERQAVKIAAWLTSNGFSKL